MEGRTRCIPARRGHRGRVSGVVENINAHPEAATLDLATVNGANRHPSAKHDTISVPPEIEASKHVGLYGLIDVVETVGKQR